LPRLHSGLGVLLSGNVSRQTKVDFLLRHKFTASSALVLGVFLSLNGARAMALDETSKLPDDPSIQQTSSQTDANKPQQPLTAEEQLKLQEQQRVMGVMATFNTTNNRDAAPLSSKQKFSLFFKSATDPWPFLLSGLVAGIDQAQTDPYEYGGGWGGYGKRYGASYGDYFIGNFFGNALLPSLLHEDPRYFQMGQGSYKKRALWAAGSTVWSKRDNGSWGFNYANIIGNLIGASVSNIYYPDSERTVGSTISRGLTVSAEGIVGAEVIEFWPDIARAHQRKMREKAAKKQAQQDAKDAAGQPAAAPKN
jgi:hypothetical protein